MKAFSEWLFCQVDRDDPVGDIAMDSQEFDDLPKNAGYYKIYRYMKSKNACSEAISALKDAFKEYKGVS
jgi:hypothetical protein